MWWWMAFMRIAVSAATGGEGRAGSGIRFSVKVAHWWPAAPPRASVLARISMPRVAAART
ncbi:hypothetical protein P3T39_003726 [Kitasatospora sp. GP82]|nr:hypothetical protein [Kitasatospora sp. GP82]